MRVGKVIGVFPNPIAQITTTMQMLGDGKMGESKHNFARRGFLKLGVGSGIALAAGNVMAETTDYGVEIVTAKSASPATDNRGREAFRIKQQAAYSHLQTTRGLPPQKTNGDEDRYKSERYYASFTKTLPSNGYGEVDAAAFRKLVRALDRGRSRDFDNIPLDPSAGRKLANPQGALKFEISGLDSHSTRIAPSHRFRSRQVAGEMAEVYWQALTRDVPFIDYDIDGAVAAAVSDLNKFTKRPGGRRITSATLFRGETPGDRRGPFISQFLLRDFAFGPADQVQRYQVPLAGVDFMTDQHNWLNIQRGGVPAESMSFDGNKRYIYNNRALGEYVHRDVSFQAYLNAALILLSLGGDAIDRGNPYLAKISNQGAFTSLGAPFVLDMVTKAANLSLTGAWYQKWRAHRFLRPEAYGGRIQFHMTGARHYEIPSELLDSEALAETYRRNGTYFLPQAFTEGSPTHPSYPAGHATVAGACVTVLKAFFNEKYVMHNSVQADHTGSTLLPYHGQTLTVGGELNKLANNISLGRDAAGVHYRQDGVQGLVSGEQQAIALLKDQSRTLNESGYDGFNLVKFDGQKIRIKNGRVRRA